MNSLKNVTLCVSQAFISGLQVVRKFNFIDVSLALVLLIGMSSSIRSLYEWDLGKTDQTD